MPTIYDNYSQIREYIDQHGGSVDLSAYVSKVELSAQSYLTAVPNDYPTYAAISDMGYLTSIPAEYVTDSELNSCGYITMVDVSSQSYATTSQLPIINESIIPKEDATYTLGDASHFYRYAYVQTLRGLATGFSLQLGTSPKYDFYSSSFRPRGNNDTNLGGSQYKWAATYTANLYADTIHNFIWTGTASQYAALPDYTTYQIYLIQEV